MFVISFEEIISCCCFKLLGFGVELIHNLDSCPKASLRVTLKDSSESLTISRGLHVWVIICFVSEEK